MDALPLGGKHLVEVRQAIRLAVLQPLEHFANLRQDKLT
jgi:hypothetical protein